MISSRKHRELSSESLLGTRFDFVPSFDEPRDLSRFESYSCTIEGTQKEVQKGRSQPLKFDLFLGALQLILESRAEVALSLESSPILARSIPINDLNDPAVEVSGSLQVELEVYNIETIAKIPELNLWASADSESEAILEIKRSLLELWGELECEPDSKLGRLPRMWKRILSKKLKRRVEAKL